MTDVAEFQPWPSIPRLFRNMIVTEKIDGTNAAIVISDSGEFACQSRKRFIDPGSDNHGFATWAYSMRDELVDFLGPGRHFGEWWGAGINRGYGMRERRFSLFNVGRWKRDDGDAWPDGLDVVPTLFIGTFDTEDIKAFKAELLKNGSFAAPGYMNPEGVVVFHGAAHQMFKSTYERYDLNTGGKTWGPE